jgi:hypothetical protein
MQKSLAAIPAAVGGPSAVSVSNVSGVPADASTPALILSAVACVPTLVNIPLQPVLATLPL